MLTHKNTLTAVEIEELLHQIDLILHTPGHVLVLHFFFLQLLSLHLPHNKIFLTLGQTQTYSSTNLSIYLFAIFHWQIYRFVFQRNIQLLMDQDIHYFVLSLFIPSNFFSSNLALETIVYVSPYYSAPWTN